MHRSGGAAAGSWRTVREVVATWLVLAAAIGIGCPGPARAVTPAGEPAPSVGALPPHDLSPLGMFMSADIVVKAVMIGLAFASVVTWTVWLSKSLELMEANRRLRRAIRELDRSASLQAVPQKSTGRWGSAAEFVRDALTEIGLSSGLPNGGIKERIVSRFERIEAAANRRMTRGTFVLATIGSTAPFVGLFGTVWGIMNSFVGIARAQTSNLAVVAPGIAEALLATASGLVAAIPAVMIYNLFARAMTGHRALVADAAAATMRLASRDLDAQLPRPAAG